MIAVLTLTRYPDRYRFFALLSMAVFRPYLWFNSRMRFHKLLGCGRNGSFDLRPDWNQYGIFSVSAEFPGQVNHDARIKSYYGKFISAWWRLLRVEIWTITLQPIQSQGKWDGDPLFPESYDVRGYAGPVAVLTRATIRFSKLKSFWSNVQPVVVAMQKARGLVFSVGIGEMPVKKQATFSIWENSECMKEFAYRMQGHKEVVRKTRMENWYAEEMFVRFIPICSEGTLNGVNPLEIHRQPNE